MIRTITALLCAATLLLAGAVAFAGPPDLGADPDGFLAWLVAGFRGRNWPLVAGGLVIAAVWLLRREQGWIARRVPWLATRWGGWTLAALLAALPALGQALTAGLGWRAVLRETLTALAVAVAGWQLISDKSKAAAVAAPPQG
mgnify:CR=1 FL=1